MAHNPIILQAILDQFPDSVSQFGLFGCCLFTVTLMAIPLAVALIFSSNRS